MGYGLVDLVVVFGSVSGAGFHLMAEMSMLNSRARSSKMLQWALAMRWVFGGPSCVYVGGFLGMKSIGPAMRSCVRLKCCNGHLRWGFFCAARAKRSCLTYLGTCDMCVLCRHPFPDVW